MTLGVRKQYQIDFPSKFARTLTIPKFHQETIFGVIGRMEVLLEYFNAHDQYRGLVPFLYTYYLVTRRVAEKSLEKSRFFHNPNRLELLDVVFAAYYFQPLQHYLEHDRMLAPWHGYFSYTAKSTGMPFLRMLLGINAHINADLPAAIVEAHYEDHKDFLLINQILEEVIPEVMSYLALQEHDLLGLGGLFFRQFAVEEFAKVIVSWRADAWQNARLLAKGGEKTSHKLERLTEQASENLTQLFERMKHSRRVDDFLEGIHSIRVLL